MANGQKTERGQRVVRSRRSAGVPVQRAANGGGLTRRELASRLGVHLQTIVKWEREGLPVVLRYDEAAVQAWLAARVPT
jgi:DNA-binding XRE family transcriptional regulator